MADTDLPAAPASARRCARCDQPVRLQRTSLGSPVVCDYWPDPQGEWKLTASNVLIPADRGGQRWATHRCPAQAASIRDADWSRSRRDLQ